MIRPLIAFCCLLSVVGCAGGGKYYSLSNISPSTIDSAHYVYEDEDLQLAAKIRSGGLMGHFWYDFLIVNKGNNPLQLNWVYDVLTVRLGKKNYQLKSMISISDYPNVLNPDYSFNTRFSVAREFNSAINDIDELIFQFGGKNHVLRKNPDASWEQ